MDLDQIATGLAFLALCTAAVKLFWSLIDRERTSDRTDTECCEREKRDGSRGKRRDGPGLD